MTDIKIEPQWIGVGAAVLVLGWAAIWGWRAYQRRARRKALLARLERVAYSAAHQVQVPDGMGGFIHIDHLLLTPRGVLLLDTRRVAGLIFGGDQMSDWTVMGGGRRRAGGRAVAVLERRKIHEGNSQVRDDAGRHRSGIPGGRSQRPVVACFCKIRGRVEPSDGAGASQPAPVHEPVAGGRSKNRAAFSLVECASCASVTPRSPAKAAATCGRYAGSLRLDLSRVFKSRGFK